LWIMCVSMLYWAIIALSIPASTQTSRILCTGSIQKTATAEAVAGLPRIYYFLVVNLR